MLQLLLAGFVTGGGLVLTAFAIIDSRSPPTVPKADYDNVVRRNADLESIQCPDTYEGELNVLKKQYGQLESKQCPPSYKSEYDVLSRDFEAEQQYTDKIQATNRKLISTLEAKNKRLQEEKDALIEELAPKVNNIADINSTFVVHGFHWLGGQKVYWQNEISWIEIFALIAPYLTDTSHDDTVRDILLIEFSKREKLTGTTKGIDDQDFRTIALQLEAYGLVDVRRSRTTIDTYVIFWNLTSKGEQMLLDTRVVK